MPWEHGLQEFKVMIKKDEIFKIGIFNKPHGVKGEVSFTFTDDIFDRVDCEYLVCLLDGIFVPFFIEEYRFRSDTTALVKLEGVDTAEKARMFTNVEVYFPKKYVEQDDETEDIPTWNFFIGFKVKDVRHGDLGEIVAVDDSTMNVLFAIEKDGEEVGIDLLPEKGQVVLSDIKKIEFGKVANKIVDVWLFDYDGEVDLGNATTDEVAQVAWMNREQIKELFEHNMFVDTLEYFFTEVDKQ